MWPAPVLTSGPAKWNARWDSHEDRTHQGQTSQRKGLTEHYIKGLLCPGPLAAGIIGISSHELITLRPDAAGTVRSGVITHIVNGLFALGSEDAAQEFIEWRSIGEVNGEVMPINMPVVDPELVFLMMRHQTPEYIMERMLYFSVRKKFRTILMPETRLSWRSNRA